METVIISQLKEYAVCLYKAINSRVNFGLEFDEFFSSFDQENIEERWLSARAAVAYTFSEKLGSKIALEEEILDLFRLSRSEMRDIIDGHEMRLTLRMEGYRTFRQYLRDIPVPLPQSSSIKKQTKEEMVVEVPLASGIKHFNSADVSSNVQTCLQEPVKQEIVNKEEKLPKEISTTKTIGSPRYLDPRYERFVEILFHVIFEESGLPMHQVISPSRKRERVLCRTVFAICSKEHFPLVSLESIGEILGNRDHTSVLHMFENHKNYIDPVTKNDAVSIRYMGLLSAVKAKLIKFLNLDRKGKESFIIETKVSDGTPLPMAALIADILFGSQGVVPRYVVKEKLQDSFMQSLIDRIYSYQKEFYNHTLSDDEICDKQFLATICSSLLKLRNR